MNIIERYTWSDALVEAQTAGLISNGALLVCMKLAKAINWNPGGRRAGMPSGLYWKNETALKEVGCSRASYFKHRKILFDLGFFIEVDGNLIPQVPDLSLLKTDLSLLKTDLSLVETIESPGHNPYSEDNTVKTYSEDSYSKNEGFNSNNIDSSSSILSFPFSSLSSFSDDERQSLLETNSDSVVIDITEDDKRSHSREWRLERGDLSLEEYTRQKMSQPKTVYKW